MNSRTPTILLVKDDSPGLDLTLSALEEWVLSNQVLVVNDGEAVTDFLYRRGAYIDWPASTPHFILLDLKMPTISGLKVIQSIKQDEQLKTIPVVVLTPSRQMVDLKECYQNGANAYVVKPVETGAFLWMVRQLGVFWSSINEPPLWPKRH